jgi:hypothetical protein
VRTQRDRHARVHPRELLDGNRVLQRGAAGAADLLGVGDAHPAQLRHLGHDLVREALVAVEILGHRGDLALCEIAHSALQELRTVIEVELHTSAGKVSHCRHRAANR